MALDLLMASRLCLLPAFCRLLANEHVASINASEGIEMADSERSSKQARGGKARAKALSADQRSEIARKAASARWSDGVPRATHEGAFRIADSEIEAAVLPNGQRLLTQGTFLRALGRARSVKGGMGASGDGMPMFLQADALKPFISEELAAATTPIFFLDSSGRRSVGYDAQLLVRVAEVYLKLRDAYTVAGRSIPKQYEHIVRACDALIRALAGTGIVALVDEATGYQDVRDRRALQAILDKFLRAEQAKWAKRFPDEFYRQIFRLNSWEWRGMQVNRPQVVAKYTRDVVYSRIAPDLLARLEDLNPKDEHGRRRSKHFQWLTDEIGLPALTQHLHATVALMRACDSWKEFKALLDRSFPQLTRLDDLPIFSQQASGQEVSERAVPSPSTG
jgi:hypothetical protein